MSAQGELVDTKPTRRGCRHQADKKGMSSPSRQEGHVVTKPTRGRYTVDRRGCRHQVERRSSHSRPMELPSPSLQEGGCRHQVDKRSSHSRPKEWGYQVNPRSGDTKSTQQWGHQVNTRSGDTKSTQERGHQVNPQKKGGDTQSTQEM
jgi:hypothetical protein